MTVCIKKIFTSNKLFVSPQGKKLRSLNKNVDKKVADTTLKQPLRQENQPITAIIMISYIKFYLDKGFSIVYFLHAASLWTT